MVYVGLTYFRIRELTISGIWQADKLLDSSSSLLNYKRKKFKKKSRDGRVRFEKIQQQESELQSSNPLPITKLRANYSYFTPKDRSEVGIVVW